MPKIVVLKQKGSWGKTQRFLRRCRGLDVRKALEAYGQEGVDALAAATPKDTGKTAASWDYKIETRTDGVAIVQCIQRGVIYLEETCRIHTVCIYETDILTMICLKQT